MMGVKISKPKYKVIRVIKTAGDLEKCELIAFRGKIYHKGFYESWQYRYVMNQIKNGLLFEVRKINQTGGENGN